MAYIFKCYGVFQFDRSEDDMGFVISPEVDGISIANEVFTLPDEVRSVLRKHRLNVVINVHFPPLSSVMIIAPLCL